MNYNSIIIEIEDFATQFLSNQLGENYYYHNLKHTQNVVRHIKTLILEEPLNELDYFKVVVAGWFHDLGYIKGYSNHEDHSIELAKNTLSNWDLDPSTIEEICQIIDVTRIPNTPRTRLQKIICDADLFDLGTDQFFTLSKQLWKEWNQLLRPISEFEFWGISYEFLTTHRYYTNYGKKKLEPRKQQNLAQVQTLLTL